MKALSSKKAVESGKNTKPGKVTTISALKTKLKRKILKSIIGKSPTKPISGKLGREPSWSGGGRKISDATTTTKTQPKNARFIKAKSLPLAESTAKQEENLINIQPMLETKHISTFKFYTLENKKHLMNTQAEGLNSYEKVFSCVLNTRQAKQVFKREVKEFGISARRIRPRNNHIFPRRAPLSG